MPKKSLFLAGMLLVACAACLWLSHTSDQAEQLRAVTVYSRNNASLSLFREWKEMARGQAVAINKEAFLLPEKLAGFDGVMIASPQRSITDKEARVLATYVQRGGRLLLSAHDKGTYANLHGVLQALDIQNTVEESPDFKNKQILAVSSPNRTEVFAPGKPYGFYSLIRFAMRRCQANTLECFAQERTIEQGKVLLTLGLPLPGNAMLSHLHNLDFTVALGQWAPRLLIDEYHHFFTQQTWQDLLLRADVAVPLGGWLPAWCCFSCLGTPVCANGHCTCQCHAPIMPSTRILCESFCKTRRWLVRRSTSSGSFCYAYFRSRARL